MRTRLSVCSVRVMVSGSAHRGSVYVALLGGGTVSAIPAWNRLLQARYCWCDDYRVPT